MPLTATMATQVFWLERIPKVVVHAFHEVKIGARDEKFNKIASRACDINSVLPDLFKENQKAHSVAAYEKPVLSIFSRFKILHV